MFYRWLNRAVKLGHQGKLQSAHILSLFKTHYPDYIFRPPSLHQLKPPLYLSILLTYKRQLLSTGVLMLISDIIFLAMPSALTPILQLIKQLRRAEDTSSLYGKGVLITLGLVSLTIADAVFISAYFQRSYSLGLHLRTALINKLVRTKSIHNSLGIVNLTTKDAMTVQNFVPFLHYSWSCPLQVLFCSYSIYRIFGLVPTVAGLSIIIASTFFVTTASRLLVRSRKEYQALNDARCTLQSSWLDNFFQVRYAPLSPEFEQAIQQKRTPEVRALKHTARWRIAVRSINAFSPILAFLACVTCYNATGAVAISSAFLIKAVALFSMLRSPLQWIPSLFTRSAECLASLSRLELHLFSTTPDKSSNYAASNSLCVRRAGAPYDVDIKLNGPALVIIRGERKELFKELLNSEASALPPHIHYCATESWIRKDRSIADNVVLFSPLNPERLQKALNMAQLHLPLDHIAGNLSQGQRKRLALARMAYSPLEEVAIVEEPLAGLDPLNAERIVSHLLVPMAKERLVIVVSNDARLLPVANKLVSLAAQSFKVEENIPMTLIPTTTTLEDDPIAIKDDTCEIKSVTENALTRLDIPTNICLVALAGTAGAIGQQLFKTLFYKYTQADMFTNATTPLWMTCFGLAHMASFVSASLLIYAAFHRLGRHKHDSIIRYLCSVSYSQIKAKEGDVKNALSIDLEAVEYQLAEAFRSFAFQIVTTASTMLTMLLARRLLIVPVFGLGALLTLVVWYYRKALAESNRLVAHANTNFISRINDLQASSPYLHLLNKPRASEQLYTELDAGLETLNAYVFLNYSLPGWLEVRLSFIGAAMIGSLATAAMLSPMGGMWASIALARSLTLTRGLHGVIRKLSDLEPYRVHLQRLSTHNVDSPHKVDSSPHKVDSQQETQQETSETSSQQHGDDGVEWKGATLGHGDALIRNFSLRIPAGSKMLIQGPSGCGKSTLVRSLLEPEIVLGGTVAKPERIGLLTLTSVTLPNLDYSLHLLPFTVSNPDQVTLEILRNLALLHQSISNYHLVLLDEITCNISPQVSREIEQLILTWPCTVIYISHSPQLPSSSFTHHLKFPLLLNVL